MGIGIVLVVLTVVTLVLRPSAPKIAVVHSPNAIRYLPLGDSYTIGESVSEVDRWPNQLTALLNSNGKNIEIVGNPSVTGYTSQDLIDRELPLVSKLKPDFVTILIGVNDYVRGIDSATFSKNLDYIISSIQQMLSGSNKIVLVTIPDYGKTPTGSKFGSPKSSEIGIKIFNNIIKDAGKKYNLPVADIFEVSQRVASDPSLVANDGLHPSAKQYADWTDVIYKTFVSRNLP